MEHSNECSKTETKLKRWKHYYNTLLQDYQNLQRLNKQWEDNYDDLKNKYHKIKDKYHKLKNNNPISINPTNEPTSFPIPIITTATTSTMTTTAENTPILTNTAITNTDTITSTNTPILSTNMNTNMNTAINPSILSTNMNTNTVSTTNKPITYTNANQLTPDVSIAENALPDNNDVNSIICNTNSICSEPIIKCTDKNICIISCESLQSCYLKTFECMNGYNCYINCNGYESCKDSTIIGDYSNNLDVICNGKYSCDNIKIQCPIYGKHNCKILTTNLETNVGNKIDIWSVNSWININDLSYLPIDTVIKMNCGNDLLNNCDMIIDNNNKNKWNCDNEISECYLANDDAYSYVNINNVTNVIVTDYNENYISVNEQYAHSELIAIFVIVCIPIINLCLLYLYCFWYKGRKVNNMVDKLSKKSTKNGEENENDENENITNGQKSKFIDYDDENAIVEFHGNVEEWSYP